MTHDLKDVQLWVQEVKSQRFLITTINSSSKFKTLPWSNHLTNCTDDDLIKAAKDQRDGWKFNGPWPNAKFEIVARPYKTEEYVV